MCNFGTIIPPHQTQTKHNCRMVLKIILPELPTNRSLTLFHPTTHPPIHPLFKNNLTKIILRRETSTQRILWHDIYLCSNNKTYSLHKRRHVAGVIFWLMNDNLSLLYSTDEEVRLLGVLSPLGCWLAQSWFDEYSYSTELLKNKTTIYAC